MLDKRAKLENFLLSGLIFSLVACGKNDEIPPLPKPVPPPVVTTPPIAEEKPKQVYLYGGDKYRDFFSPAGSSGNYQTEAVFDPQKAAIRGLVYSSRMKSAVLNVMGGGTYFAKEGKLFDIMGKTVKGYSVKILADRVILSNESDATFEIKMKNDDEEAKRL